MKTFIGGMNKDTELLAQPEGTYRDALNINLNYTQGSVLNEEGVYRVTSTDKFIVCGFCVLDDDRIVLFGRQETDELGSDGSNYTYFNQIKLLFPKEDYSIILYEDSKLNFRRTHRVQTTHRKNQAGETLVYFTDGYYEEGETGIESDPNYLVDFNPPRVFNVDKQYERVTKFDEPYTRLYGQSRFDADNLRLTPYIGPRASFGIYTGEADGAAVDLPAGNGPKILTGGALKCGAYYLAIAYEDDEGQTTNYFEVSAPVFISSGPERSIPTTAVTGGTGELPTNKSIAWRINVPNDVLYNKIRPAVIAKNDEVVTAFQLAAVNAPAGATTEITYTGLEGALPVAIEDIVIDDADYIVAQSITQQNNRLYLGNLKTNKDIGYQGFANQIKLETVVQPIQQFSPRLYDTTILNYGYSQMFMPYSREVGRSYKTDKFNNIGSLFNVSENTLFDLGSGEGELEEGYQKILKDLMQTAGNDVRNGYKNVKLNNTMRSYKRGEVYAFYISFVMKDGTESYAYHIPGRAPLDLSIADADEGFTGIREDDSFGENTNSEESLKGYGMIPLELTDLSEGMRICEVADTTDHTKNSEGVPTPQTTGFWSNSNEVYPNIPDFSIAKTVDSATGNAIEDTGTTPLSGQPVRHHKMPSNHSRQVDGYMTEATATNDHIIEQSTVASGEGGNLTSTNPTQTEPLKVLETVNILGVKFKNIRIPKYIFDNIQGYKIYYAKRKTEDKTILGQSLAIPAHPRFASAPEQSAVQAKKGPYYRGWYLYGGLRGDEINSLKVNGRWRPTSGSTEAYTAVDFSYVAHPVFTFHDFNLMRRKADLSGSTHISAQYGVVFRHFLGGPGQFIPPCQYDKLKYSHKKGFGSYSPIYLNDETKDIDRECTVLPSSGWVSPELRNTVSFTTQEGITGTSYVVDVSDNVKNTSFKLQDGSFDPDANSLENYQLGRIVGQEDDDASDQGPDVEAYRLSRLQRVRAYFTGMFIGTAYVNPYVCLARKNIITGGDYKNNKSIKLFKQTWSRSNTEFSAFSAGSSSNNLNLAISPNSLTYIESNSTTKVYTANSFLGATFLYNRGGESSILIGLQSGLPTLRGHLPRFDEWDTDTTGSYAYYGLTSWSDSNNYYFPDAPDTSHPLGGLSRAFQYQGGSGDPLRNVSNPESGAIYQEPTGGFPGAYDPESGRGLNFALLPYKTEGGMPMAWLVNLCAAKTDVFQPFDQQELVWTGHYVEIDTSDDDLRQKYYDGTQDSPRIFGGDTYISKYSFRTTSQSYGHSYFRLNQYDPGLRNLEKSDPNLNMFAESGYYAPGIILNPNKPENEIAITANLSAASALRHQGDVPLSINGLSNSYGFTNQQSIWQLIQERVGEDYRDNAYETRNLVTVGFLQETGNWKQGTVDPVSSLFEFMVESDDNIEMRYSNPIDDSTRFFGQSTAKQIIFSSPENDLTKSENILYSEHYSAVQDVKVTIPLPVSSRLKEVDTFAIRVARSTVDSGSLADGYRKFKALDYKDIDSNRGEIQNMFSLAGTLYIHTKRALFVTRGKEELQLAAVTAFIGSGDIFSQDPDEIGQSSLGHGGTDSRHAHITTEYGHFYINRKDRAVYSMSGNQIQKISDRGMQTWFRENLEFEVARYGIDLESAEAAAVGVAPDSTTTANPTGFTIGYDPKYKRILITKREPVPTEEFITQFNAGNIVIVNNIPTAIPGVNSDFCVDYVAQESVSSKRGQAPSGVIGDEGTQFCGPIGFGNPKYFKQSGWTLSYYPEKGVWGSRHSYLPDLYMSTTTEMYSMSKDVRCDTCRIRLWKHTNTSLPGGFYGDVYNSEIEFVENTAPYEPKLFSSVFYWVDSYKENNINTESERKTNPGFTSFYVYNSTQISGSGETINYLSNARLVDRVWRINNFRDLSKQETITEGNLISPKPNVSGRFTSQVISNPQSTTMFTEEGKVNADYIDADKSWFNQGKFIDHYMVIRLINDNSSSNLVHLHGAGAKFRKSHR